METYDPNAGKIEHNLLIYILMNAIDPFCEEQKAETRVKFKAAPEYLILRSFLQRGQSESRPEMGVLTMSHV